jgi:actin-related protein
VDEFAADESAAKEIQSSVDKDANKGDKKEEEEKNQDETAVVDTNDINQLKEEFKSLFKDVKKPEKGKTFAETVVKSDEFEKDDDNNFHIDFMATMGNCRAESYKLEAMDWIQVKLKAGRIVPAMATTTAAIAGLQALELVKLLRGVTKEQHRNVFLNLAVPIMQASEPGDV